MLGAIVTTFHGAGLHADSRSAGELLLAGAVFGSVHSLSYGCGAWLFRRSTADTRIDSPGAVLGFLMTSTVASLCAALSGLWSLWVTGGQVDFRAEVVPWWIGDLVAIVTLVPLLVLALDAANRRLGLPSTGWWESLRRAPADSTRRGFAAKLGSAVVLALALGALGAVRDLHLPVALVVYALIVPLMWVAHTEGPWRTIVTVASLSAAVVVVTRLFGSVEEAFNYQAAMVAIAGTGLFNLTVPALYADNLRLRDLVAFDPLTGAGARSSFLEKAAEEIERAARYGGAVSLVVVDLDRFKSINDTLGHPVGDRVLARVGELFRAELRKVDLFGRLGGEEFAILLPTADATAARQKAESLREVIAGADWSAIESSLRVTASFGVAQVELPEEALALAIGRADRALYEAKRRGRDRVCSA